MNNLISEQSGCISHEIRNHLSICELYTQIIKKNLEKNNINIDSINNAVECIKKSLKIMNNCLLDLKSLDNFEFKICDLKKTLEQGILLSQVYIAGKNITINCNIKETVNVNIDENKFLACVVNIIKNGIEAIIDKGKINISVEIKEKAVIIISNNGDPVKNPENIFKEGFTTKASGSGLGLYICKNNLEKQNAELNLIKSDCELTVFEIKLPIS